jgi:transposase
MPKSYRPYSPNQATLLPACPADWLPEGHLALAISEIVDQLDLRNFRSGYKPDARGNQPYDPAMMVKVLVYGYLTGTFSSRKIQKRTVEDVAVRYLAGGNFPKYRAIADFRVRHRKAFADLFDQVVRIGRKMGFIKGESVAIDGSKLRANASKRKAMSYGRMKEEEEKLKREIDELLTRAEQVDREEDELYGEDREGDEIPEELKRRETRLKKIQEAKAQLEQEQRERDQAKGRTEDSKSKGTPFKRSFGVPEDSAQKNFTDPESRIMKTSTEGFQQCYNIQAAVDDGSQMMIATEVGQCAADTDSLVPMIDRVERTLREEQADLKSPDPQAIDSQGAHEDSENPRQFLADAGYKSEANFKALEERPKVVAYITLGRERKAASSPKTEQPATEKMRQRMQSAEARQIYARRKHIVEPVFGWVKNVMGFRSFSVRGHDRVSGEWNLVTLAVNMKRLATLMA